MEDPSYFTEGCNISIQDKIRVIKESSYFSFTTRFLWRFSKLWFYWYEHWTTGATGY